MEEPQEREPTLQEETPEPEEVSAANNKPQNRGHLYKRDQLVLKYEKTKEAQDSVFDMMQLLAVVLSFATMFFAVGWDLI